MHDETTSKNQSKIRNNIKNKRISTNKVKTQDILGSPQDKNPNY